MCENTCYERLVDYVRKQHNIDYKNMGPNYARSLINFLSSSAFQSRTKDTGRSELLDAIIRNAKRLQRLTENILDVTRIESQSLQLNKERFSLNEIIRNVINDVNNQARIRNTNNKTVSILFEPIQDIFVEADKVRIYEVISNVLKNAIQFTKEEYHNYHSNRAE